MKTKKILFQISGSIAAFKACAVVSKLVQEGFDVQAVCTPGALNFVGIATLEGLTGRAVLHDTFAAGHAMDHIFLARDADLSILCPATASTINKLAAGIGDDLVSTLFLAQDPAKLKSATWIVPAMNPAMYTHPATQASLKKLRDWGVRILEPADGRTACGEIGPGRMVEPDALLRKIHRFFSSSPQLESSGASRPRVLITSGATREPIDAVRFLTNFSTGTTGAAIADIFLNADHEVVYLHGVGAAQPTLRSTPQCETRQFDSVADLDAKLNDLLGKQEFELIIHAAAVGDFTVDRIDYPSQPALTPSNNLPKLSSTEELRLFLRPTPKLINTLRARSKNPSIKIVAFKLTHGSDGATEVKKLLSHCEADWVVQNQLSEVSSKLHKTTIYDSQAKVLTVCTNKTELGRALLVLNSTEVRLKENTL